MSDSERGQPGFWSTLPGLLTGLAAVIAAGTTAIVTFRAHTGAEQHPGRTYAGPMGPLESGVSFNQGDFYDQPAASAEECRTMCYNDNRCIAMTYIISQKRCFVKNNLTGRIGNSADMISARRMVQ